MIRKLLVATDGTPVSRRAEDLAIELARALEGHLVVLAAVHIVSEEERGDQMAHAMEHLAALKARAEHAGLAVEGRIVKGKPDEVIVRTAREEGVDAIVVGTSGKAGLEHALLGSTAEAVLRKADRTVIVAK
ncbi:MAG: universal stress protein [Thermoplasmatota archaeon]